MSNCATPNTQGFYFGYFWIWYMNSQAVGNAIGGAIIESVTGWEFFALMGFGMVLFAFIIVCCIVGTPEPTGEEPEEEDNRGFCELLMATLKLLVSKKMSLLLPIIMYSGTSIAVWSGLLTPFIELQLKTDPNYINKH
jgi:MFS family permease